MKFLKLYNLIIASILIVFAFGIFVNISYAADPIVPGAPGTIDAENTGIKEKYKSGSYELNDFIRIGINASQFILGIVGSLTLLMFMYGGVWMIISQGNSQEIEKAKSILKNAIIGLVIVFTSWTIINFTIKAFAPDGTSGKDWYQLAK